jgi:hypothetical protein
MPVHPESPLFTPAFHARRHHIARRISLAGGWRHCSQHPYRLLVQFYGYSETRELGSRSCAGRRHSLLRRPLLRRC